MSKPRREITIAIFSKPPVVGEVKTRLAQVVGAEGAAQLATAFLVDTLNLVQQLSWAEPILSTTGAFTSSHPLNQYLADIPIWNQGDGDLGARMERVLRRGLDKGAGAVIALGADVPGLPPGHLEIAREELENHETVIGPSGDGGYYLLGVKRCPRGMLRDLPWSSPETFEATRRRLDRLGLSPAMAPSFSDIDVQEDLAELEDQLRRGVLTAPTTMETLSALGRL